MFPLKYKIVCFHLANTKQYVSYRKTKDAKDMFFSIRITKDMFSLDQMLNSMFPITSQNYVSSCNTRNPIESQNLMFSPDK